MTSSLFIFNFEGIDAFLFSQPLCPTHHKNLIAPQAHHHQPQYMSSSFHILVK